MALTKVGKEGVTGISNSSDATAITIDSSENVGISNTTPGSYYSNSNQLVVGSGSARQGITIASSTSTIGQLAFADGTSGDARFEGWVIYDHNTDHMSFGTSADERMRIDSAGKLLIGTTTELFSQGVLQVKSNGAENIARFQAAANGESIVFENASGTAVGSIQVNASATAFNTSSDYRLKTQVTYDWDATTRLKQLKPARFKWIADGDDAEFVDGFIAHELTAVPDAISGKGKDAVDDDGNPVLQGVDQSKIVPLLVKSLQEAIAKIETLETKVQALEDA